MSGCHVSAKVACEDRMDDLLDRGGGGGTRDAELHHLTRALEHGLVGIDVAGRDLSQEPFGGGAVLQVHGAEAGEVDGAIRERPAEKRKFFEGALGLRGLPGSAKGEGAQPFHRDGLGLRRDQLERLRAPARLHLRRRLLQRTCGEIGGELGVAKRRTADELLFEVVLAWVRNVGACGNAAHEEGRNEE
jgi:hypothetical protein